jgi:hypothetical protein
MLFNPHLAAMEINRTLAERSFTGNVSFLHVGPVCTRIHNLFDYMFLIL